MVLTWTQKEFGKEFFRFRKKKKRLYSKDNSVRLVVWRWAQPGKTVSVLGCSRSIICALENESEAFAIKWHSIAMEVRKHHKNFNLISYPRTSAIKSSWTLGKSSLTCFEVSYVSGLSFCHFIFANRLHCYLDSILNIYTKNGAILLKGKSAITYCIFSTYNHSIPVLLL